MTSTDLTEVRQQIEVARQEGDIARANELYKTELDLLRGRTSTPAFETGQNDYLYDTGLVTKEELYLLGHFESDEDVKTLASVVGAAVRDMKRTGRKMGSPKVSRDMVDLFLEGFDDNQVREITASVTDLPRALHTAGRFLQVALKHHPDLAVPDDFVFWRVALPVVERIQNRLSDPTSIDPSDAATDALADRTTFLETLAEFEDRISDLQNKGRHREANLLYQEQQKWIASQLPDNRIVGSGGRLV